MYMSGTLEVGSCIVTTNYFPLSITVEEAKEIHRGLKLAAGMFLNVKDNILPKLQATAEKGVDTDPRVVEAYAQQAQGEAQEVTIGRALEMGHKPSIIFSLAMETSVIFKQASEWEKGWTSVSIYTIALYTIALDVGAIPLYCILYTLYLV